MDLYPKCVRFGQLLYFLSTLNVAKKIDKEKAKVCKSSFINSSGFLLIIVLIWIDLTVSVTTVQFCRCKCESNQWTKGK